MKNLKTDKIALYLFWGLSVLIILNIILVLMFRKEDSSYGVLQKNWEYQKGWTIDSETKNDLYVTKISRILPDVIEKKSSVVFFTGHHYVDAYIGEEHVYSHMPAYARRWSQVGEFWNFIDIEPEDHGKQIDIYFYSERANLIFNLPNIYFGNEQGILLSLLWKNVPAFIISFLMITFGILIITTLIWAYKRKKIAFGIGALSLGLFDVGFGVWSLVETQMLQLFVGYSHAFTMISDYMIVLIVFPVLYYTFWEYPRTGKKWKTFRGSMILAFPIAQIVLIFGSSFRIIDNYFLHFASMLLMTLCGGILVCTMFQSKRFMQSENRKRIWIHIVCVVVFEIAIWIDYINHEFFTASDGAFLCRWVGLVYLLILFWEILMQFMYWIKMGKESEKIKDVAFKDPLTGLGNRTAFFKKLSDISEKNYSEYGIAMYDLNNLKYFNDTHGHSAGDYYLIICSEIIRDMFSDKGDIFRIGGDEFCAILRNYSEDCFKEAAEEMRERIHELKGPYVANEMSVAYGYCNYDESKDEDLSATMERADEQMYKTKIEMKSDSK